MSQNNAIPPLSRPPPSQASANATAAGAFASSGGGEIGTEGGNNNASANGEDGDAQSAGQTARVHDHTRPFPPPRLPSVHVVATSTTTTTTTSSPTSSRTSSPTTAPLTASTNAAVGGSPTRVLLTAPLTPLSSSYRSRPSPRGPQTVETSNETSPRVLLSGTDPQAPPRSPVSEVSLTVPRPDGERTINEYVEAPFKHCCNQGRRFDGDGKRPSDCPKIERRHRPKGTTTSSDAMVAPTHRLQRNMRNQPFRGFNAGMTTTATSTASIAGNATATNAVTKQPVSFTKEPANTLASRAYDPAGLSIMCDFCGRCRCESCREPPPLPSRWLCDNSCFCSADTILDYASCLCCVKGFFYHCVDGGSGGIDAEAGDNCADEPCSCTGNRRASRWACLGALSLVMPCLLCYWPFKGCVALCEACYARHAAQGCRCNPSSNLGPGAGRHHPIANDIGDSRDPEKRLLDPVTPEL